MKKRLPALFKLLAERINRNEARCRRCSNENLILSTYHTAVGVREERNNLYRLRFDVPEENKKLVEKLGGKIEEECTGKPQH